MIRIPRYAHSRGAAAVEMAFTVMFLLLVVSGLVDLGRVIYTSIGVQDAAQEGARFAAYDATSADAIEARILSASDDVILADLTVDPPHCGTPDDHTDTRFVTVSVSQVVDYITPVIGNLMGGSIDLTKTLTVDVLDTDGCQL